MTLYAPEEILRQGLKTWWEANTDLAALPIAFANDDGSPASTGTTLPSVVVRVGDCSQAIVTNQSFVWEADFTFEFLANSPQACATAAAPLDTLLESWTRKEASLPAMPRGTLDEFRRGRSNFTQLGPMLWRADRECRLRLVI